MGKCSTLFYIIDNTNKHNETELIPFEELLETTDSFLSTFFNNLEIEVDSKVVNRVLEACR